MLEHRENTYFNSDDYFLLFDTLNKFVSTRVHFYNGNWYANNGLQYKMTSVPSINCNELIKV